MVKRKVLFLCTGNSARSQMGEGMLRHHGGDEYEAFSAGADPRPIHPLTVQVMSEIGIDISGQYSKSVREYMGRTSFDDVIVVCRRAEDDCPAMLADAKRVHRWLLDDPVKVEGSDEERLAAFRSTRDQLQNRLQLWIAENAELKRQNA